MIKDADESNIIQFDSWLCSNEIPKANFTVHKLSFKNWNDLLTIKHFPNYIDSIKGLRNKRFQDDQRILSYFNCQEDLNLSQITFQNFQLALSEKFRLLPNSEKTGLLEGNIKNLLIQDLTVVAFSLERWGQYQGEKPGNSVKTIMIGNNKESLHFFINRFYKNYNTLEFFALKAIPFHSEINIPIFKNGKITLQGKRYFESPYSHFNPETSRYPTILKIDSFHSLLKKGEIVGQVINLKILEFIQIYQKHGALEYSSILKIKEIILLFNSQIEAYKEFLTDHSFNEYKFVYFLRQLTVELDESPYDIVFKELDLEKKLSYEIKGFLNHFLNRKNMTVREKVLYIVDILALDSVTVEIGDLDTSTELDIWISESVVKNDISIEILNLINEIRDSEGLGMLRLRFALDQCKKQYPATRSFVESILKSKSNLENILTQINSSDYKVAPSGANSLAFIGPDILLGHYGKIENYNIHVLNRIQVMAEIDQSNFWNLIPFYNFDLYQKIFGEFKTKWNVDLNSFITREDKKTLLAKHPYLSTYIELYESYSKIVNMHMGIVQKYLNRFSKKMVYNDKIKLKSSPDHGTTYMKNFSNSNSVPLKNEINLPSLKAMVDVRSQHPFISWVHAINC